jgi:DNA-binding response OmpR family regulator
MLPTRSYQIAFVEPAASATAHLRQLLEFEGIGVSVFEPADLQRLRSVRADVVVVNQSRLRRSTYDIAMQVGGGLAPRPLTVALVTNGEETSGIELVERGLDAFIVTPCGSREFVARVRALLRRAHWPQDEDVPAVGERPLMVSDLAIDPQRRRARLSGCDVRLTEQEFQLLYFLASNPGRVFDRPALLDAVWGTDTYVTTRSVDALVKRVRHQLRAAGGYNSFLETVRGVGYRLSEYGFPTGRPHPARRGAVS